MRRCGSLSWPWPESEYEARLQSVRAHEQELARVEARLSSLMEIEASRGEFGDAARMVLVQANGRVGQRGAVADYLDVDRRYERAVEACLGDLLQHVVVERHDQAAAGLALVREHDAGRCGFVVIDPGSNGYHPREALRMPGIVPISDVLRVAGPHVATIQKVMPEAYVAETFEQAVTMSRQTAAPVATIDGDLFRGPHLVSGGAKVESRGILATKREIKELRERLDRRSRDIGPAHGRHDSARGCDRADQDRADGTDQRPTPARNGYRLVRRPRSLAQLRRPAVSNAKPRSLRSNDGRRKRSRPPSMHDTRRRSRPSACFWRTSASRTNGSPRCSDV